MRILFIHPPYSWDKVYFKPLVELGAILPPLGVAYIASVLEKDGHEVKIIDGPALSTIKKYSLIDLIKEIKNFDPYIIGITVSTSQLPQLSNMLISFSKLKKTPILFLGGSAIASDKQILMDYPKIDYGIIGEAEYTFSSIVKKIQSNKSIENSLGLVWRENKKIKYREPPIIENLDLLPFPARHLLDMSLYRPSVANYRRLPSTTIVSSRGCPYSCTFCSRSVEGLKFRAFSAEYVVNEMEHLSKKYGIKDIQFFDDIFTMDMDRAKDICKLIIKKKLDIGWNIMTRIDRIDNELLHLLKKAGCYQIGFGIESASDRILKNIKKGISIPQVKKFVSDLNRVGIDSRGFFIIGFPTETRAEIQSTINLMLDLDLHMMQLMIFTPFEGTSSYSEAKKHGKIDSNLSNFTFFAPDSVPYVSNTLKKEDLLFYYENAYRDFYLRPKYLLKQILKIRSLTDIKRNMIALQAILSF